jgi:hypothetical protein
MRTSQINPQIAINALMGYLGTYNYYYSWYNFIHNTYDNNFTGYVPIPGKENPFIALEAYLYLRWCYLLYLQRLTIANYVTPYKPSLS